MSERDTWSERDIWLEYKQEKQKLQQENLSPEEYEKAIKELCEKLGI